MDFFFLFYVRIPEEPPRRRPQGPICNHSRAHHDRLTLINYVNIRILYIRYYITKFEKVGVGVATFNEFVSCWR